MSSAADPEELGKALRVAPLLERIEETDVDGYGPCWQLSRVCIAKHYPGYEIHDRLSDLTADAVFQKIPFESRAENRRGILAVLTYTRENVYVFEVVASWAPLELECELDEWIGFLNASIQANHKERAACHLLRQTRTATSAAMSQRTSASEGAAKLTRKMARHVTY